MSNFDRWLTTDTAAEEAERRADHKLDAWESYAGQQSVPLQAVEEDHPEHEIYVVWEKLFDTVEAYFERLRVDEERSYFDDTEAQIAAIREEEQMVRDSMA